MTTTTPIAGVSVRRMTPEALPDVVRIDEATTGRPRPRFHRKRVISLDQDDRDIALVAERDGQTVGFAFTRVFEGELGMAAPVGVLDWIGVDPPQRGAGVGRILLDATVDELDRRGVHQMRTQAAWNEHNLVEFFAANGFQLAPRIAIDRPVDLPLDDEFQSRVPPLATLDEDAWVEPDRALEVDFAPEVPPDVVLVRSLEESDLEDVVQLDRLATGQNRVEYYQRMVEEALHLTGIRLSLVAELEGRLVGVMMVRADYGEFGKVESGAVLDTVVVEPGLEGRHVARAMLGQLLGNLKSLCVDVLRTEVAWDDVALVRFFAHNGFTHAQRLSFVREL
ncbi:MAG: GNAT family N-acetyltransferase [Tetrasphaera sp.]